MHVTILGAGPAGLAAADALAERGAGVTLFERADQVGGMCRTVERNGYRFDLGGHRFFTRFKEVEALWHDLLGEDLLRRTRKSRILYGGSLFEYPLAIGDVVTGLGPLEAARCLMSYAQARARPRGDEHSFEDWVRNRFGDRLFETFFQTYTEKVWGMPCSEIGAEWAAQRIKKLDLSTAVKDAVLRPLDERFARVADPPRATSLVGWFWYPRLGPGMMFEALARRASERGARVATQRDVIGLKWSGRRIVSTTVRAPDGTVTEHPAEAVISSIPLTALVRQMSPAAPQAVLDAARALRFRHLRTVNLVLDRAHLFPDQWVYVHDPSLTVGRVQNFGSWSPWMLADPGTSCVGLEYFCSTGDPIWEATDDQLIARASDELERAGLARGAMILDASSVRVPRAYPVYDRHHRAHVETIRAWLDGFENLQPIGRYGMFKYNNSDHSVLTAFLAVENLFGAQHNVWAVNTDTEYHEIRPGR